MFETDVSTPFSLGVGSAPTDHPHRLACENTPFDVIRIHTHERASATKAGSVSVARHDMILCAAHSDSVQVHANGSYTFFCDGARIRLVVVLNVHFICGGMVYLSRRRASLLKPDTQNGYICTDRDLKLVFDV